MDGQMQRHGRRYGRKRRVHVKLSRGIDEARQFLEQLLRIGDMLEHVEADHRVEKSRRELGPGAGPPDRYALVSE